MKFSKILLASFAASTICVTAIWSQMPQLPQTKTKEDWTTPTLKGSELKPMIPQVGEADDEPEFKRELVRLQWRVNDPIDTYIVVPRGVSKPPVIVFLYNYSTNTDRFIRS